MKARIASVVIAIMMTVLVLFACPTGSTEPAAAQAPIVNCEQIRISTQQVRIRCDAAGIVVLNTVLQLPQVTLPPVTLPGATITLTPPRATATVRLPGATTTQFVEPPTETKTIREPGRTVTATATETVTENQTVSPPGQDSTEGGTIDPGKDDTILEFPQINLSVPEAVAVGLGTIVLAVALIILGMWGGYYLGYKDSDKAEATFLKSLLK